LPFYSAVWTAAKSCNGLTAFNKAFYWKENAKPRSRKQNATSAEDSDNSSNAEDTSTSQKRCESPKQKRRKVVVDIVARGGLEWVKVSTTTETRLLFEMAKAGWEAGSSSSSCSGDDEDPSIFHDSSSTSTSDSLSLLKVAIDLSNARKSNWIHFQPPAVLFVLPRITLTTPEIQDLIADIRATGAVVQTAEDLPARIPPLVDVLPALLVDPFAEFSDTLNIDCTVLLALVSDLSHGPVTPKPWFHRAIRRQIEMEAQEPLLPKYLWPALGGRVLVCTSQAARRMYEIVDLIGTESEKGRAALLMTNGPEEEGLTKEERLTMFQKLTQYDVPRNWNIPITVQEVNLDEVLSDLPDVAGKLAQELSAINKSVFLHGWRSGLMTISSNRTVAKQIEMIIEENRVEGEDGGPRIWLCPTARSLVGKEKDRRE
jgi:hypothetical protein